MIKIPVWVVLLLVVVVIGFAISKCDSKKTISTQDKYQKEFDSLLSIVDRQQMFLDSQSKVLKKTDSVLTIKEILTYEKPKSVYNFTLNEHVNILNEWTRLMQDSCYRERYFRNLPPECDSTY